MNEWKKEVQALPVWRGLHNKSLHFEDETIQIVLHLFDVHFL